MFLKIINEKTWKLELEKYFPVFVRQSVTLWGKSDFLGIKNNKLKL